MPAAAGCRRRTIGIQAAVKDRRAGAKSAEPCHAAVVRMARNLV